MLTIKDSSIKSIFVIRIKFHVWFASLKCRIPEYLIISWIFWSPIMSVKIVSKFMDWIETFLEFLDDTPSRISHLFSREKLHIYLHKGKTFSFLSFVFIKKISQSRQFNIELSVWARNITILDESLTPHWNTCFTEEMLISKIYTFQDPTKSHHLDQRHSKVQTC